MKRLLALAALAVAASVVCAAVAHAQEAKRTEGTAAVQKRTDTTGERVPVPEPGEKALRHHRSGNVLWVIGTIWGLLVPITLLATGVSARIRDLARRIGRHWYFTLAIYVILFSLLTFLIDLPLAYYQGFVRPHQYDLSNQTFAKWATDTIKALLVSLVISPLVLWVPYLLLRRSPQRWWLYSGLAAIPLIMLMLLIGPVWIDPLFNEFGPMKDKQLEQEILSLARRAGIEGGDVFEVNKSVDTKTVNAYVAGFLNTKRIVLWDTILAKLDREELLFVMGHEMGHYVLRHVAQIVVFASIAIMIGLYFVHRTAQAVIARYRERIGFSELGDIASLPLMGVLFSVAMLVLTPAMLAAARHNEHEADRFGLEITRSNHAAASAFVKLQQENLGVPRPGLLYKLWRSSHPPLGERIDFCNDYRPWEEGKPLRYREHFRE